MMMTKKAQLFFLFFISLNAHSGLFVNLGAGGLTPHYSFEGKKSYCNQWNNTGAIFNRTQYITLGVGRFSLTYMKGEDSICSPIEGGFFRYDFIQKKYYEWGVVLGGYGYKEENWLRHKEETDPSIKSPEPVSIRLNGDRFVPVLALSFNVHLIRGKRASLKLNNLFAVFISNHSLAWEYRF